ncbi:MAG: alpha/beta fold hydrolase, partial [Sediminibacterium sp.]|nr:alpha/beta fold hydrolase [Sediminibacterium sp.]
LFNIMIISNAYKFTHFFSLSEKPSIESKGILHKISTIFLGPKIYKSLVVDSLHIKHDTIQFKSSDSLLIESWYIPNSKNIGTVILFHGHGANKSYLIPQAHFFYSLGYNVYMPDFRAHGNSAGETCSLGMIEYIDVQDAYNFIQQKGEKNIILYGISFGASTLLKAMEANTIKPNKIILEMPYSTLLSGIKGKLRIMGLPEQPLSVLLAFWIGTELGTWAFNFKPVEYAKMVHCPVLLQWGILDPRVTEKETNEIFKNLASHNKFLVKYVYAAHENLLIKEKQKWENTVIDFLNK